MSSVTTPAGYEQPRRRFSLCRGWAHNDRIEDRRSPAFSRSVPRAVGLLLLVTVSAAGVVPSAGAQALPTGPIEFAGGTIRVTGDVSLAVSSKDDIAFFNYTDYEHNALRLFRVSLAGTWRPTDRFAVLTEFRSEDVERVRTYALYARVRPWKKVPFDIQAGRIPPVFGVFGRHSYGPDNPLIGYPLAYQYLTSLRPDSIPATADDLLLMRARGWQASYPVGSQVPSPGVPLVTAYRWDTGVEGHLDTTRLEAAAAITVGTLSNPRVQDDNDGRQVSGRVAWKPALGLVIGASAAEGEWLNGSLKNSLGPLAPGPYRQDTIGLDAEYSRDYWIVRSELVMTRWTIPQLGDPPIDGPLDATSAYVEGRYRFNPRFFAAGRVDGLTFSKIRGERLFGGLPQTWDAPVSRLEIGGGMYLQRNLTLRAVVQRNSRDGGRVRQRTFVSGEIAFWF